MKQDLRTMHQLLGDLTRTIGDPEATPEELEGLAASIRRRANATAKDLEAVAEGRRGNGRRRRLERRSA